MNYQTVDLPIEMTLGSRHCKEEYRNHVTLGIEPAIAATNLRPGERVGIINGRAYPMGVANVLVDGVRKDVPVPFHGVVDPFLSRGVSFGASFWVLVNPRAALPKTTWSFND